MTTKQHSGRGLVRAKIKDRKDRTVSSARWLERQINDPYVHAAKAKGYRSRAAFKIVELDDKYHFLKKGARVLDLGAAPGGWSQIAADRVGSTGRVVAMDILEMEPIDRVTVFQADMLDGETPALVAAALGGPADVVLTDMAAPTTGHRATDHLRTTALLEAALDMAEEVLKPGGIFVGKAFRGGAENELLQRMKKSFTSVKHVKPPASRAESVELIWWRRDFAESVNERSAGGYAAQPGRGLVDPGCRSPLSDAANPLFGAFGRESHYKISHPSRREILTVPFRRPIKPVYIRRLVRFIEAVGADSGQP